MRKAILVFVVGMLGFCALGQTRGDQEVSQKQFESLMESLVTMKFLEQSDVQELHGSVNDYSRKHLLGEMIPLIRKRMLKEYLGPTTYLEYYSPTFNVLPISISIEEEEGVMLRLIGCLSNNHVISSETTRLLVDGVKGEFKTPRGTSKMHNREAIMWYAYELESFHENHLLSYFEELKENGLLSQKQYKSLNKAYSRGEVTAQEDLLLFLENSLFIPEEELPQQKEQFVKKLVEAVVKMDASLQVENLEVKSIPVDGGDKVERVTASCSKNGISYGLSFFDDGVDEVYSAEMEVLTLFNRILTDQGSDYRLFSLWRNDGGVSLVKLNKAQYEFLVNSQEDGGYTYFNPNWYKLIVNVNEGFSLLTTEEVKEAFDFLDNLGLFGEQSVRRYQEINRQGILEVKEILPSLDSMIYDFDWEMTDLNTPYLSVTKSLASISRGKFSPTQIYDDFNYVADSVHFGFVLNGKEYATTMKVMGDWYSPEFLELIDNALEEQHVEGRFYPVNVDGQANGFMFLTLAQYEVLKARGLVEVED